MRIIMRLSQYARPPGRRVGAISLLFMVTAATGACANTSSSITVASPGSGEGTSAVSSTGSSTSSAGATAPATSPDDGMPYPGKGYCQTSVAYYGIRLAPPATDPDSKSAFAAHSARDAIAAHVSQEAAPTARSSAVGRDAYEATASDPQAKPGTYGVGASPRPVWVVEESGLHIRGSGPAGGSPPPVQTHAAALLDASTLATISIQLCP